MDEFDFVELVRNLKSVDRDEQDGILWCVRHEFEVPRAVNPISPSETVDIINLLIDYILVEEDDEEVRGTMLRTIMWATFTDIDRDVVHWELLRDQLNRFNNDELRFVLYALGGTHDLEYIPVIEKFLSHSDSRVREYAQRAIDKINRNNRHID